MNIFVILCCVIAIILLLFGCFTVSGRCNDAEEKYISVQTVDRKDGR